MGVLMSGAEGRLNPTEPDPSSMAGTEAAIAEGGLVPSLNPTEPGPSSMAGKEAGTAEGGLSRTLSILAPELQISTLNYTFDIDSSSA